MLCFRTSAFALIAVVALAGCGASATTSKPSTSKPGKFSAKAGLLGNAASAGAIKNYVPTGKIIADSGFRATVNGFAFENYGNDAGPANLTPVNVEHLFGPQVCATGDGATCRLTPSAKQWMAQENVAMANGHCMGFSVTALRFYSHNLTPSSFGAARTVSLPVQGNTTLQSTIAEDFAYQNLSSVRRGAIVGTPTQVVRSLVSALNARKQTYTLAIIKADGTGGHAITPFAVEDRGAGRMKILVYDNNFPGVARAVDVNTTANTWHYVGGINPSDTSEIYDGNAQTKSMLLFPTTPGEGTQPCPFCAPTKSNPNPAGVGPSRDRFIEVALAGPSADHPHLLFVDPKSGQKTGFSGGQLLQQIPGILVNQNFAVQNWHTAPEPTYDIQFGHPVYEIVVDGTNLKHPVTEKITVNGAGVLFVVANIKIAPGQKDTLLLPNDDLGVTYASYSHTPTSPIIAAEFPTYSNGSTRFVVMQTALLGYAPGSPQTMRMIPSSNTAEIGSPGKAVKVYAKAAHLVWVDSTPINGGTPEHAYRTINLDFNTDTQLAHFSYLNPSGPILPIQIVDANDKLIKTASAPPVAGGLNP